MFGQTLNERWGTDFWAHLGTVREMAERPWHPRQPFVGVDVDDPFLSPYMLLLGLATRWSGADAVTVLAVAGLFNLGLWLYAFRRFVLVVTGNRGAPVWALLFTLLAWGISPWRWSGYFNLNSIGFGLPYPSMFASAVAMLALSSAHLWLVRGHRREVAVMGLAVPIVLLTHPFTALWSAIAGIAIIASNVSKDRVRRLGVLIGAAGVGAGLALAWPHNSLLKYIGLGGSYLADPDLYRFLARGSFLAVPGLVALAFRARRNPRDALVWMFVGTALVFVWGGLTGTRLGRVFPGMMLAAHVALGDAVAVLRSAETAARRRLWVTAAAAGLLVIGLPGSNGGLIRTVPRALLPDRLAEDERLGSIVEPYRPLSNVIGLDDRVVASLSLNRPVAGISGDVLVPPTPTFLDDLDERVRVTLAILSPSTIPEDRRVLLDRWDICFLVLTPAHASSLYPALGGDAEAVIQTDDYVVLDVSAPLGSTGGERAASGRSTPGGPCPEV
jgi:hypothetical protein